MSTAILPKPKRQHRIQPDIHDSLLEERLKIANVILPEDNLEDLVQIPIAPELVSRRVRAQRARDNANSSPSSHSLPHNPLQSAYDPISSPAPLHLQSTQSHYPSHLAISCPSSDDEHALHTHPAYSPTPYPARAHSDHRASHPPDPPGSARPSGIPKPAKHPYPRPSLSADPDRRPRKSSAASSLAQSSLKAPPAKSPAQAPLRKRTQSSTGRQPAPKPSTAPRTRLKPGRKHSHPTHSPSRPRSLSASSVIDAPLPPWSTDPSPRIYRLDPLASGAEPGFDDLILPAVARQLEKQQKLRTVVAEGSAKGDVSEWEAKGTPVLIRKVSRQRDSSPGAKTPDELQPSLQQIRTRSPSPSPSPAQEEQYSHNLPGGGERWSVDSAPGNHPDQHTRSTQRDPTAEHTPELSPSTSPEPTTGYEQPQRTAMGATQLLGSEIHVGHLAVHHHHHQRQQQGALRSASGAGFDRSQVPFSGLGRAGYGEENGGLREVERSMGGMGESGESGVDGIDDGEGEKRKRKKKKSKMEREGDGVMESGGGGGGDMEREGDGDGGGCSCRCSVM